MPPLAAGERWDAAVAGHVAVGAWVEEIESAVVCLALVLLQHVCTVQPASYMRVLHWDLSMYEESIVGCSHCGHDRLLEVLARVLVWAGVGCTLLERGLERGGGAGTGAEGTLRRPRDWSTLWAATKSAKLPSNSAA